jgi:kumamolisin
MPARVGSTVAYTRRIASWSALLALVGGCQEDAPGLTSATQGAAATNAAPETDTSSGTEAAPTTTAPEDPTGWFTTGSDDPIGPCSTDPLCDIPPEEKEPTPKPDGIPSPLPGVYDDLGPAPPDDGFRSLMGFPTRQRALLEERVAEIYDPESPEFRQYLTVDEWMADHAPLAVDYELVKTWLRSRNFTISFEAKNRLLIHFTGTVKDFNETFNTELHICMRKNPLHGGDPFPVYCTLESFTLPKFIAARTNGLATADLPAETGELTKEVGEVKADYPGDDAHGPPAFYGAYKRPLFDAGYTGQGSAVGVVAAGTYHSIDLQIYWKSFGIERALPTRVSLMEPVFERITETVLDTQWSSSLAPGADVYVYEGPDARNTALLFAWNEAIADNKVDVLTNSFAHREDAEPKVLRHQYDESALMAAAIGMTLVSASGDSAKPDTPCGSPYVTCVGGTNLKASPDGKIMSETAWSLSGSGQSKSFALPYWQMEDVTDSKTRATADVALSSSPQNPMWVRRWTKWEAYGGTSFASPAFAGMVAVINSYRYAQGKPRVGFLNPVIYLHEPTRKTFRDIKHGGTAYYDAGPGWDYPTGLGAPDIAALAEAIP